MEKATGGVGCRLGPSGATQGPGKAALCTCSHVSASGVCWCPVSAMPNLFVRLSDGTKFSLEGIEGSATIGAVKDAIHHKVTPPCEPARQRLIYRGRILKDSDTVDSCGG